MVMVFILLIKKTPCLLGKEENLMELEVIAITIQKQTTTLLY